MYIVDVARKNKVTTHLVPIELDNYGSSFCESFRSSHDFIFEFWAEIRFYTEKYGSKRFLSVSLNDHKANTLFVLTISRLVKGVSDYVFLRHIKWMFYILRYKFLLYASWILINVLVIVMYIRNNLSLNTSSWLYFMTAQDVFSLESVDCRFHHVKDHYTCTRWMYILLPWTEPLTFVIAHSFW